jgi:hypothetical protein
MLGYQNSLTALVPLLRQNVDVGRSGVIHNFSQSLFSSKTLPKYNIRKKIRHQKHNNIES